MILKWLISWVSILFAKITNFRAITPSFAIFGIYWVQKMFEWHCFYFWANKNNQLWDLNLYPGQVAFSYFTENNKQYLAGLKWPLELLLLTVIIIRFQNKD